MKNRHIIWIGSIIPDEYYAKLCSKGYHNQEASRIAQNNIVIGLEKYYNLKFNFISGPALPAFPRYKEILPHKYYWGTLNNGRGVCVGYLNIEYLNRLFKAKAMKFAAKELAKTFKNNDELTIYINTPHSPFITAGLELKRKFPKSKLVMIVPDLPQFMESNISRIKQLLKIIDNQNIKKSLKYINFFILYTEKMLDYLNIPKKNYIIMEGCVNVNDECKRIRENDNITRFVYSGKVDKKFGIKILIESFMKISQQNCILQITGSGDMSSYVDQISKMDPRIVNYGFIKDYYKVSQIQKNADFLLNMRLPSEPASKYCFPSKLFEYMKTGNPVISFMIGGIPKEYYKYMITIDSETSEAIRSTLEKSIKMTQSERKNIGSEAKKFIMNEKNVSVQTKKIFDFVENELK